MGLMHVPRHAVTCAGSPNVSVTCAGKNNNKGCLQMCGLQHDNFGYIIRKHYIQNWSAFQNIENCVLAQSIPRRTRICTEGFHSFLLGDRCLTFWWTGSVGLGVSAWMLSKSVIDR